MRFARPLTLVAAASASTPLVAGLAIAAPQYASSHALTVGASALLLSTAASSHGGLACASKYHHQQIPLQQAAARAYSTMSDAASAAATVVTGGTKDSKGQDVDAKTWQLIKDAQDLFSAKPSLEIFKRSWDIDAVFADPIAHAEGFTQYAAQWFGMPKAFSESRTLSWSLVSSTPQEVQYNQSQHYKVRGLGTVKQMDSLVVMQLNEQGKIKRFEDRWNGKELPSGSFAWALRRLNAKTMPWIVGVPKDGFEQMKHSNL